MSTDSPQESHSLEDALAIVRNSKSRMIQCLDNTKLMDGLKHASTMLAELRTSILGPKQYYELYMSVFDALGYLSNYLSEAHKVGRHHLADLYELVQYAGNIVPRLYLMITVGSVYMGLEEAPIKEIMRDMMEMSRGVQHPIRGLFLRHYLSGQTRNVMPVAKVDSPLGTLQDSVQFTLTNFIEMNKLWVRLQHQGHSRERQLRELERTELKTLVGTNLVRLSQLDGLDLQLYGEVILPAVLEQVIQCRDVLAQEYLLEVITQVYPDEYHLRTLDQYLSAIAKLNPHVNVKQIVIQIIDRLAGYAARAAEEEAPEKQKCKEHGSAQSLTSKVDHISLHDSSIEGAQDLDRTTLSSDHPSMPRSSEASHEREIENFRGIPSDVKLFEIFWQQIVSLVKTRPEMKIQDVSAMLVSLCNMALNCYPAQLEYIDQIFAYGLVKTQESADSTDLHSKDCHDNLLKLLLAPISHYTSLITVLAIPSFVPMLNTQSLAIRRAVAAAVADCLVQNRTIIDSPEDAESAFGLMKVLISDEESSPNPGIRDRGDNKKPSVDSDQVLEEQGWLARLVHHLQNDDLETQYKLLQVARDSLVLGAERARHTFPSIVMATLKLVRKWKEQERSSDSWSRKSSSLYKFIHQAISNIYQCPGASETAFHLFLFAGQVADQCNSEEVAYEFFAQAFSIYEDAISESRAQFQAVSLIMNALQQTRSFSRENYDTLITKCALHGAKLLKKPDQTRAILAASHLWWATEISNRSEEDDKVLYRDDKRVLECLQKSLKIADACMDTAMSIQLFIEILNQYIYYFDRQNEAVSEHECIESILISQIAPKFICGLIDLIKQNLENMEPSEVGQKTAGSSSALCEVEGSWHDYITKHFERTIAHIQSRKDDEDSEHWAAIQT